MAYRIKFAVQEDTLYASVQGKSSLAHAAWIGQDIAEQASAHAARRVLIDLRGLADRVGTLGALLLGPGGRRALERHQVGVLDVQENDSHYAFSEAGARARGLTLRYFAQPSAALSWLRG